MFRFILFSLLLFSLENVFYGQSIKLGPVMKNPPKNFGAEIIGKDEEGFYVKRLSVNRLKSRRARKLVFDYSL